MIEKRQNTSRCNCSNGVTCHMQDLPGFFAAKGELCTIPPITTCQLDDWLLVLWRNLSVRMVGGSFIGWVHSWAWHKKHWGGARRSFGPNKELHPFFQCHFIFLPWPTKALADKALQDQSSQKWSSTSKLSDARLPKLATNDVLKVLHTRCPRDCVPCPLRTTKRREISGVLTVFVVLHRKWIARCRQLHFGEGKDLFEKLSEQNTWCLSVDSESGPSQTWKFELRRKECLKTFSYFSWTTVDDSRSVLQSAYYLDCVQSTGVTYCGSLGKWRSSPRLCGLCVLG